MSAGHRPLSCRKGVVGDAQPTGPLRLKWWIADDRNPLIIDHCATAIPTFLVLNDHYGTAAKPRLAMAATDKPETKIGELVVVRQTLYRHLGPDGTIRPDG